MVKINRIYTRAGDDGKTALIGGARIAKHDLRVCAYGEVDELNSWIGWARTISERDRITQLVPNLERIQNELFDLGAELATPSGKEWPTMARIGPQHATYLENCIDDLSAGLSELNSFVLPGGSQLNSVLHVARTVCRRAERSVSAFCQADSSVSINCLIYINRLSDLLFAMARYASKQAGIAEYLWQPGAGKPR